MADPMGRTAVLGIMLVLVGLAFKLSLFPFHQRQGGIDESHMRERLREVS